MNIGDYVRTKFGEIARIVDYKGANSCGNLYELDIKGENDLFCEDNIIKSSPNIIDLIEEGDYVNGYKVLFAGAITWDNDGNVIDKRVKINYGGYDRWLSEDFIKSIVTSQQFSSMEYKIGDCK